MRQTKLEFRNRFLEKRKKMRLDEVRSRSHSVAENLTSLFKSIPEIVSWGGYRALPGEVDLDFQYQMYMKDGMPVAFPRVLDDRESILFFWATSLDRAADWEAHAWGIQQPNSGLEEVVPKTLHALVVPLLCCDRAGNRIGFGKGCYDRFLSGYDGWKIGVAFDWQISEEEIPSEKHDIAMDFIVCESDIIPCSSRSLKVGEKFT